MSQLYGNDFISLTDENGNEFELEHLDTIEYNKALYMAFLPADLDEDDEHYGMIILKVVEENGEDVLVTVDNDAELEAVFGIFIEMFSNDGDVEE
jgi:uncharacterized protein YrzB (UPF0473 family)